MTYAYNLDCMEAMKQFPDKFFDLAIVDPPYGGGCSKIVNEKRGLIGGAADFEKKKRSRFGGMFDKYSFGDDNRRNVGNEVSDAHRGYL